MNSTNNIYERKILPHERQVLWQPNSNIAVGAKIKGFFTEEQFKSAVNKLQKLHPLLKVKVFTDEKHEAWFSSKDVPSIPIKIVKRTSEKQWITEFLNENKKAFGLGKGPLARFILVKSKEISELIIICHHIICDGKCLPLLVKDILSLMNNENQKPLKQPHETLLLPENLPGCLKKNYFIEMVMKIMNENWKKNEIIVTEKDYQLVNKIYWQKYTPELILKEFTKKETTELVNLCRKNNITVTSGICMSIIRALQDINHEKKQRIDISVDLRKFLIKHPKETIANYVGKMTFVSKYNQGKAFWDNAQVLHKKMINRLNTSKGFEWVFKYNSIEPTLIDAIPFIYNKEIALEEYKKHENLSKFLEKSIAVYLIGKNKKNITNLLFANIGRVNYPLNYGDLEIDRLIPLPAPSEVLDLVIGVETIGGKMTMTFNYIKETIDQSTVEKIINRSLKSLEIIK